MKIFDGDNIAINLNALGVPCKFAGHTLACQNVIYNFVFSGDYPTDLQRKITTVTKNLQIIYGVGVSADFPKGLLGGFALKFARSERFFPSFLQVHKFLEGKKRSILLGLDENIKPVIVELEKLPHLLIGGSSGSGKSVLLNSIICQLISYNSGKDVALALIDVKRVEFAPYKKCGHLCLPIATDFEQAIKTLNRIVNEMERRYKKMERMRIVKAGDKFPHIVVIVDELADLMLQAKKEVLPLLARIAQKGRAANICLICATQQPVVKVVDGLIKANLGTRVCLQTRTATDSTTILGHGGGEKLIGMGDALVKLNTQVKEIRIQVPFVDDNIINKVVNR